MALLQDLKILYHLALRPVRGRTHAERMESFYSGQAAEYDNFRKRLLHGREQLFRRIDLPVGGQWVDLGGGTGANLDFIQDRVPQLKHAYVVDLAGSLLEIATTRFAQRGWEHVEAVTADATTWQPTTGPVDVVTFSYSLTMIPDWFAAIENALRMLRPGGVVGVVDFYVSRKHATDSRTQHGWFTRTFWPTWFSGDNVFPSPDHLPYLLTHFEPLWCQESRSKVPYLPFLRAPYYQFIGRKPAAQHEP